MNKQGFIQPHTLAKQDIVITTYDTLRREINYVDLPHTASELILIIIIGNWYNWFIAGEDGRKFRNPKRFMATPSPITAVEWWRVRLNW